MMSAERGQTAAKRIKSAEVGDGALFGSVLGGERGLERLRETSRSPHKAAVGREELKRASG